jgi:predicted HicB family RNase H-like nuclease
MMSAKGIAGAANAASRHYLKIVGWSSADGCFVGRAPGLFFGGCHGDDERKVYLELCDTVEEHLEDLLSRNEALPEPTAGKRYSGKFNVRIGPELHKKAALQAMAWGISLN